MEIKHLLSHRLLNLLTVLQSHLSMEKITAADRREMEKSLHLATVLIAHEDIFLGNKTELFFQKRSLHEFLNITLASFYDLIVRSNIQVALPETDREIEIDQYFCGEMLRLLLEFLIPRTTVLNFSFSAARNTLVIGHDRSAVPVPLPLTAAELLQRKDLEVEELAYQLALLFAQSVGSKIDFKATAVEMFLPQKMLSGQ